jgi:Tfp pilus assembly protein FimV
MKTAILFGALILVIVSGFSLASLFAQEKSTEGPVAAVSGPATEPAGTLAAVPVAPQPAAESAFSLEKIIIGLGLSAVIVLAVFRWGSSSRRAKEDKAASAPDTPAP